MGSDVREYINGIIEESEEGAGELNIREINVGVYSEYHLFWNA